MYFIHPDDESEYNFRAPTQQEIDNADAHSQEELEAERCGCRGGGWILTSRDVWHKCHVHYAGQTHPEHHYPDEACE